YGVEWLHTDAAYSTHNLILLITSAKNGGITVTDAILAQSFASKCWYKENLTGTTKKSTNKIAGYRCISVDVSRQERGGK
ncbi:hypothetical protein, partial [Pectobacterium parvum]|uniref:hypothetical protein n=1 Tax=Pectobacterium parvum TaxID=2778550 RepID=UPI0032EEC397